MTLGDPREQLIVTLMRIRTLREHLDAALADKPGRVVAYASAQKAKGVSQRQLGATLEKDLLDEGWTPEQIEQVGVSQGSLNAILAGEARRPAAG